jgi:hypothetical protein
MVTVAKVSASLCKSDIVWLNNKTVQTGLGLGLWCLTPLSTIFQLYSVPTVSTESVVMVMIVR